MGIPSYFSHIIKQYPFIIKKFKKDLLQVNNLYLDCNSIIYDVFNKMLSNNDIIHSNIIIQNVIKQIEYYISIVKPNETVIIAFDGVAPIAKLEQQRNRRYKTWYQSQIKSKIYNIEKQEKWKTSQITPGTMFMKSLDNDVTNYFNINYQNKHNIKQIVVTGSNICGEGEHKIFEFIRNNKDFHLEKKTFIYGLDADLIMLCINHLNICPYLYLFRETPEFIKSIDSSLEPNENYYLDIKELTINIPLIGQNGSINKIYDYIFICFLLGNDFLPHFPALNIRTGGIHKIMDAYCETIKDTEFIANGETINWNNVYKFIKQLSVLEESYIIEEYKMRNKREKYVYPLETQEDKLKYFDSLPTIKRDIEKYINPFNEGWQNRYYNSLFKADNKSIQNISINYLEGLEWTFKYYSKGCYDWRWCYKYHYPPLLQDLVKFIPVFNTEFIPYKQPNPVTDLVQLCYVLPESSLELLPKKLYNYLITNHNQWYRHNCNFVWAYCRYFWECHVDLPEICIDELENIVNRIMS
jgi:5'-3' exoribonuclease 1